METCVEILTLDDEAILADLYANSVAVVLSADVFVTLSIAAGVFIRSLDENDSDVENYFNEALVAFTPTVKH